MQRVCGISASLVDLAIEVLTTVLFEGLTSEMGRRWQMDGLLRDALGNALPKVPHQGARGCDSQLVFASTCVICLTEWGQQCLRLRVYSRRVRLDRRFRRGTGPNDLTSVADQITSVADRERRLLEGASPREVQVQAVLKSKQMKRAEVAKTLVSEAAAKQVLGTQCPKKLKRKEMDTPEPRKTTEGQKRDKALRRAVRIVQDAGLPLSRMAERSARPDDVLKRVGQGRRFRTIKKGLLHGRRPKRSSRPTSVLSGPRTKNGSWATSLSWQRLAVHLQCCGRSSRPLCSSSARTN